MVGRRDMGKGRHRRLCRHPYTSTVLISLEDAGFCPKGTAGRFIEEHDLRWNGDLPLDTHGGQLS